MKIEFSKVREAVPVAWFFEHGLNAGEPKQMRASVRFDYCPNPDCGQSQKKHSIKVSVFHSNTWKCFACGAGGDVIDAAVLGWSMPPREAAARLINADQEVIKRHVVAAAARKVPARDDSALREVIKKLVDNSKSATREAIAYLESRGIAAELTEEAVKRQLLVTLPAKPEECKEYLAGLCGREMLAKAGIWHEDSKAPAAAFKPLFFVSWDMSSGEFRTLKKQVKDGEQKTLRAGSIAPWAWVGKSEDQVMITEGCIDMLSALQLGTERSIIALPGCENWRADWFTKLKGREVLLCLDNDGPGQTATKKLEPVLKEAGAVVHIRQLPEGIKDLNELLKPTA